MFTMETTNPTHFQLYIQIMHYADILWYCTESIIVLLVILALVTSENCTNELY